MAIDPTDTNDPRMRAAIIIVLGTLEDLVRDGVLRGGPWLNESARAEYEALPSDAVSSEYLEVAQAYLTEVDIIRPMGP
jgi:hypothetical protein